MEKLHKLNLSKIQEREIIHVTVHCALHEKTYNPYYTLILQRFAEYDRRFQVRRRRMIVLFKSVHRGTLDFSSISHVGSIQRSVVTHRWTIGELRVNAFSIALVQFDLVDDLQGKDWHRERRGRKG